MATYSNPRTLNVPWKALVLRRDPDYERDKRNEVEYDTFSNGRVFRADRSKRGAYTPDED